MRSSPVVQYDVILTPVGFHCDVHARFDASGPAWIGVYDRERRRWYTSTDQTLTLDVAVAALDALTVQS